MADDGAPSTACTGSSLLQPLSELTDLPLDQVRAAGARTSAAAAPEVRHGGTKRGEDGEGRRALPIKVKGGGLVQTPAAVMEERLHAALSRKEEEEGDVAVRIVPIVMMMKGEGISVVVGGGGVISHP